MNLPPRILVAGIGNIFLADDAFGVRVAELLMHRQFPPGVRITDFGIRGLDLAYTLLDDWDAAILIDAVPRGEAPGTLFVIEPELDDENAPGAPVLMEGHSMDPARVLQLVRSLGGRLPRVLVVGCEPAPFDSDADINMELTPAVAAAIEPAARRVESIVNDLLAQPLSKENRHVPEHTPSTLETAAANP
jgi:hydrogenase maturation protease